MSTIVIRIDGVDVTDDVIFKQCSFQSLVNGSPGQARLRIKDTGQTYVINPGDPLTLDVDSVRVWGGYVTGARKVYPLSVIDTSPLPVTRLWEVLGHDYNVLFNKRVVWKESDPTGLLDFDYDADTYDDTIINDIFDNYLSISGDGLTRTGVTRIAKAILDVPGKSHHGMIASAGYTWKQMMDRVARATGGVYYISPTKVLTYVDVETATSSYSLSDVAPDVATLLFQDDFSRTVPEWDGWGNGWTIDSGGGSHLGHAAVDGSHGLSQAHQWFTAIHPNLPLDDFDMYLDIKTEPIGSGQNWYQYIYGEMGSSWFDIFPDDYPTASPYPLLVETGSNSVNTHDDVSVEVVVVAEAWYTVRWAQFDGHTHVKFWPRDDPEPDDWLGAALVGVPTTYPGLEVDGGFSTAAQIDNLIIRQYVDPTVVGYQGFTLLESGSDLVNDMLVWGAGTGSNAVVFSRSTDNASVTDHHRWQAALFSGSLYRQASADLISASYVNGTPQSHRGGKDDAVSFSARVFEPVFTVGQVVDVSCGIFDYSDTLPIRSMTTTFNSPTEAIFDLVLGHLIDLPVGIDEFMNDIIDIIETRIQRFPPLPCPPGFIRSPSGQCIPPPQDPESCTDEMCLVTTQLDDFNRTVVSGWGTATPSGWVWNLTNPGGIFIGTGSVGSGSGLLSCPAGYGMQMAVAGSGPWTGDFVMTTILSFLTAPSSNIAVFMQAIGDARNSQVWFQTHPATAGVMSVNMRVEGDAHSDVEAVNVTVGDTYVLVWEHNPTAGVSRAKLYPYGGIDPGWQVSRTMAGDSSGTPQFATLLSNGFIGVTTQEVRVDDISFVTNRCTAVQFDDFQRTVPSGYGFGVSTPSGYVWHLNTGGGNALVNPGAGFMAATVAQGGADLYIASTGPWSGPFIMRAVVFLNTAPTTSGILRLRFATGANEESRVSLDWGPSATALVPATITVANSTGTTDTSSSLSIPAGGDLDVDPSVVVEWEHDPANDVSRARVYQQWTTPPDWQASRACASDVIGVPEWSTSLYTNLGTPTDPSRSIYVQSIEFDYDGKPCYIDCDHMGVVATSVFDNFNRVVNTNPVNLGTATPSGYQWVPSGSPIGTLTDRGINGTAFFQEMAINFNRSAPGRDDGTDLWSSPIWAMRVRFRITDDISVSSTSGAVFHIGPGATGSASRLDFQIFNDTGVGKMMVTGGGVGREYDKTDWVADTWYIGELLYDSVNDNLKARVYSAASTPPAWQIDYSFPGAYPQIGVPGYFADFYMLIDTSGSHPTAQFQLDNIEFDTIVCGPVPTGSAPNQGYFCETLVHGGGTIFYTTKAFLAMSLEVWTNGLGTTPSSTDGTTGLFVLSTGISTSDILHVCYQANGEPLL